MSGMIRVFLGLLSNYGMDTVQIGLIIFLFWKLFTNHLAHIEMHIGDNKKVLDKLNKDFGSFKRSVRKLESRVSHVEGQLDIMKK